MVYRTNAMTKSGEFQADLLPVGDGCKAEQPAADFDFMWKVIAVFGSNVVDERTAVDVVVFTEH